MGKTRKVLTAEELVVKQEADYLKKQKANQAWRQNNPENYEYFKTTYMKKYYEDNKVKLNAQTKERRLRNKLLQQENSLPNSSEVEASTVEASTVEASTV